MRIIVFTLLAALLGIAVGVSSTLSHFIGVTERFDLNQPANRAANGDTNSKETLGTSVDAHVEVVNGADYDFGEMERSSKRSHKFVLKNVGTVPLKLEAAGTSCSSCTILGNVKNELQPDESTEIQVEWTASTPDPEFRKEAYIRTNDAAHPKIALVVHGKVLQLVLVQPPLLALGNHPQSSSAQGSVMVYFFTASDIEFGEPQLANSGIAQFFDVKVTPMSADALAQKPNAKQGISLDIHVQPGLPLGTFTQTIRLPTNFASVPHVEVQINGVVGGDISIAGAGIRDKDNIVSLGVVDPAQGAGLTLQLIVKGPHRHEVNFEVASIDPAEVLSAKLGTAKSINDGAVITIPLRVEIPPNRVATSRTGGKDSNDYGKIILRTTHPTVKEITLLVWFAMKG